MKNLNPDMGALHLKINMSLPKRPPISNKVVS